MASLRDISNFLNENLLMVERSPRRQVANRMYHVYVLKSLKNGRLYTGSTNHLERRISEHNGGLSKYTKSIRPFELVYSEEHDTKAEAYSKELFLKTGKGRELLKTILDKRA